MDCTFWVLNAFGKGFGSKHESRSFRALLELQVKQKCQHQSLSCYWLCSSYFLYFFLFYFEFCFFFLLILDGLCSLMPQIYMQTTKVSRKPKYWCQTPKDGILLRIKIKKRLIIFNKFLGNYNSKWIITGIQSNHQKNYHPKSKKKNEILGNYNFQIKTRLNPTQ